MQDMNVNCLNHWCPSLQGPCVQLLYNPQSPSISEESYSAVYCHGDADGNNCGTDLLMDNVHSGICEHLGRGYRRSHPREHQGRETMQQTMTSFSKLTITHFVCPGPLSQECFFYNLCGKFNF